MPEMTEDPKPVSQSKISTTCDIPNGSVLRWIVGLFPDSGLADDARIVGVSSNYFDTQLRVRGSIRFEIQHTTQPTRPAGPILFAPIHGEDAEGGGA
jgi:hypothetical protein